MSFLDDPLDAVVALIERRRRQVAAVEVGAVELEQAPLEIVRVHRVGAGRDLRFVVLLVAQDVPARRRVSGAVGAGAPAHGRVPELGVGVAADCCRPEPVSLVLVQRRDGIAQRSAGKFALLVHVGSLGSGGPGCCSWRSVRGQRFVVHPRVLGFEFVVAGGARSRESDAERARGVISGLGEQPDGLRFEADQFSASVALRLVVDQERGCVPSELVPVGSVVCCRCPRRWLRRARRSRFVRSPPPVPPLLVRRVGEHGFDLLVACVHAQHRDRAYRFFRPVRCVSSRRVARIRPLRPMCQGYSRSMVWMRSIAASIRSRGTAWSFVMGGSRPARGGLSGVVPDRVIAFRSCSIPVVWLLRTVRSCGAAFHDFHRLRSGRMSRWMSARAAALRARRAPLSWCSFLSLKCGRWMPFALCVLPVGSSMKAVVLILRVVAILVTGFLRWMRGCCCSPAVVAPFRQLGSTAVRCTSRRG